MSTHPRARNDDPITSHEAADQVQQFDQKHHHRILNALHQLGQAGAEQIAAYVGLQAYAVRKRLPELSRFGFARPTGQTRRTAAGRAERLWEAV